MKNDPSEKSKFFFVKNSSSELLFIISFVLINEHFAKIIFFTFISVGHSNSHNYLHGACVKLLLFESNNGTRNSQHRICHKSA